MSVLNIDPSLPSNPSPLFSDVTAARGDHLRANNAAIWGNFTDIDTKKANLASPAFTGGVALPTWTTGLSYTVGQIVLRGQTLYLCISAHTAATFMTDFVTNSSWIPLTDCPGIIKEWGSASIPSGSMLCDGSLISKTTYADLFSLLGTTWGAGDVNNFNIPDLRGVSLGGVGSGVLGVSPETFILGSFYDDKSQGWQSACAEVGAGTRIFYGRNRANDNVINGSIDVGNTTIQYVVGVQGDADMITAYNDGTNGDPRKGLVTRGKVVGVNFIIKVL